MIFSVFKDCESMSEYACGYYVDFINSHSPCVLGLATGSTPELFYEKLSEKCKDGKVSFKDVMTFNLDEYCGIGSDDPQSYVYFMRKNLFDNVDISDDRWNLPPGVFDDPDRACADYDRAISEAGGIDIQLLGLGNNGHIGFNEPAKSFPVGTHVVKLDDSTIEANSRFFDNVDDVPKEAITMGIGTIMRAKSIVVMATGKGKAEIVKRSFAGEVVPEVPASVLRLHRDVLVLLDADAASEIVRCMGDEDRLILFDDLHASDFRS